MTESDFWKKITLTLFLAKRGQNGVKTGFLIFFLKNGSKDFSDFLPKVRGQYRLTTGENRLFRKNLNFAPGGQKGPKNHPKMDPPDPKMVTKKKIWLKITQFAKKSNTIFFGPFWPILAQSRHKFSGQKCQKWVYGNNLLKSDQIWMKLSGSDNFMIIR